MTEIVEPDAYDFVGHTLNSLGVGVWSWQGSPSNVHCCPVVASFFDVPVVEGMHGLPLERFAAHVHPDDRERFGDAIGRAMREGGPFSVAYRTLSSSGVVRHVLDRGEFAMGSSGHVVAANGLVFDMTNRTKTNWIREDMCFPIGFESLPPLEQAAEYALALYRLVGVMPGTTGRLAATLTKQVLIALSKELSDGMDEAGGAVNSDGSRTLN